MTEDEFIALVRPYAGAGARDLRDDAAVLSRSTDGDLVLTHDVIVEGVHFRPEDAPDDVAWKLVAVNLSDLAAKGATPLGVLVGYPLGDEEWDRAFAAGLGAALRAFDCALLGGDTVTAAGPRSLSLTAVGRAGAVVPSRGGARPGDGLWVTGVIGLAGMGLVILDTVRPERSRGTPGGRGASTSLGTNGQGQAVRAYLRPQPRLGEGHMLAPLVTAMMDVSDGLLIDAERIAAASGVGVEIVLESIPVPPADLAELVEAPSFASSSSLADGKKGGPFDVAQDRLRQAQPSRNVVDAILQAVTAGDDYELLFTLPPGVPCPVPATRIGMVREGAGLSLSHHGARVPLPARLGYRHG